MRRPEKVKAAVVANKLIRTNVFEPVAALSALFWPILHFSQSLAHNYPSHSYSRFLFSLLAIFLQSYRKSTPWLPGYRHVIALAIWSTAIAQLNTPNRLLI